MRAVVVVRPDGVIVLLLRPWFYIGGGLEPENLRVDQLILL